MTDLVQKLVGALEHCEGVFMSHSIDHINGGKIEGDALAIIRAALSEAKAGGWMPIETAPVGADVLLLSTLRRVHVFVGDWGDFNKHNHPRITHWQPLPNPPKEQA